MLALEELSDTTREGMAFGQSVEDVTPLPHSLDDPLVFEPDQCLAHGRTAHASTPSNVWGGVLTAAGQFAQDAHGGDSTENLVERERSCRFSGGAEASGRHEVHGDAVPVRVTIARLAHPR